MAGFFLNVKSKGNTSAGGQGGKDGITPDIQIGTVTTLEPEQQAIVTREGTNENPIFNFGIPKGNVGDMGKPGEKGVDGIDGKSLEFNWNGTELGIRQEGISDYQYVNLEGKRGEKGDKGERGLPGKDGATPDMSHFEDKIKKQYETIEKKIDEHIENHPQGGGNASIDDSTISTETTWSSSKIGDFVLTNDDVIWSTVQGENLSIDYTKEGYLREVEIYGNTIQNQEDLSDIQHLGELYMDNKGQNRYKIDIMSFDKNINLIDRAFNYSERIIKTVNGKNQGVNLRADLKMYDRFKSANIFYLTFDFKVLDGEIDHIGTFNTWFHDVNIIGSQIDSNNEFNWFDVLNQNVSFLNDGQYHNFKIAFKKNISNNKDGIYIQPNKTSGKYVKFEIKNVKISEEVNDYSLPMEPMHKTAIILPCQLMKVRDISDRLYWDSSKGKYVIEKNIYDKVYNDGDIKLTGGNANSDGNFVCWGNIYTEGNYDWKHKFITNVPIEKASLGLYGRGDKTEVNITFKNTSNWNEVNEKLLDILPIKIFYVAEKKYIETNIGEEIKLPTFINNTYITVNGGINGSIKAKAPIDGGKVIGVLQEENRQLKQMDNELVATSWDMDFRMCAIEWSLEDLGISQELMMLKNNMKGSVSNMALSRYEQAKIMIVGGVYKKITLTKQLTTYLNRGYLTQEEYDELIALMEAKDLVVEE